MNFDWARSKYSAKDLDGKSIDYTIQLHDEVIHASNIPLTGLLKGEGRIRAQENETGLRAGLLIMLRAVKTEHAEGILVEGTRLRIPIEWINQIVRNPKGSKTEFSLDVELKEEDKGSY